VIGVVSMREVDFEIFKLGNFGIAGKPAIAEISKSPHSKI
jgi:hypothetical protein